MSGLAWHQIPLSFQGHDLLKKAACLFAGLGHLQPLLLATTNSHYLLDRFCMERCCSSEYISRIVTSIIFMEVMATLLVACLGAYMVFKDPPIWKNWGNPSDWKSWLSWKGWSPDWQGTTAKGQTLNDWNDKEEKWRGYISSAIQCLITLGYIQILLAFTTGGKKGHMHWFYLSLMFQQFVCLLIGGAIGFWEAYTTLWYLMAIPMGPIPVFFYQLMIHSWIRNNGPRYPERLIVERQIWLAISISCIATICWIYAYATPYYPIELDIPENLPSSDRKRINTGSITLQSAGSANTNPVQSGESANLSGSDVKVESVTLTAYSVTLTTAKISTGDNKYVVNLTIKAGVKILFSATAGSGNVTVETAKITEQPKTLTLNLGTGSPPTPSIKVHSSTVTPKVNDKTVTLTIQAIKAGQEITLTSAQTDITINTVEVTIPVKIEVVKDGAPAPETITSVNLTLPANKTGDSAATEYSKTHKLNLEVSGGNPLSITVAAGEAVTALQPGAAQTAEPKAKFVKVSGTGFSPNENYCISSVVDKGTSGTATKRDIWTNITGKCSYVAFYYKKNVNKALLTLYFRNGEHVEKMYFGTNDTSVNARDPWKEITKAKFIEKLPTLASGSLTLDGDTTPQYNRVYKDAILNSPTWAPLVMHGMAVGSFGSIFPNLIPKTLTCPKTSRTLSVVSIFLSPVPHIINLALAEYDSNPASCAWTVGSGIGWLLSYSLYLFYILAILFAIFNVHYPEWKLCCYIRSHGWMPFMMTLSITLIIEILIAIARAGIMMQKPAGGKDKNHPLLWNKIFCLMSLSYLPFWMTTTPMMKSYVSSLDPFLCDKDRDHWPTARYGRMKSFGYWCKCACRGLYTSPRKLITRDMRKALTRKDPKMYFLVTHDIPPEEWLWTFSSIIILITTLLTH